MPVGTGMVPYGLYQFPTGSRTGDANRPIWNFEFSINTDVDGYVWCMTVPPRGSKLRAASMGRAAGLLGADPQRIELLGSDAAVEWKRDDEALWITCPDTTQSEYAIGFKLTM